MTRHGMTLRVPAHARGDPRAGGGDAEVRRGWAVGLVLGRRQRPRGRRAGDAQGDAAALRQSGGDPVPFALAALRSRRPRSLAGAGRAPVRTAEGGGRAPAHGSRRGVGAARCRCGTHLVVSRAGDRRDLCPLRGAGRGQLPHVRQRRLQPRCQGRSAARRRRAARRIDADGYRHGLPGEGAQSADRPGGPRRAFAQAGRRRPVAAGRPVRHRGRAPR